MSHTYDVAKFEAVINSIEERYLPMLNDWYMELLADASEAE